MNNHVTAVGVAQGPRTPFNTLIGHQGLWLDPSLTGGHKQVKVLAHSDPMRVEGLERGHQGILPEDLPSRRNYSDRPLGGPCPSAQRTEQESAVRKRVQLVRSARLERVSGNPVERGRARVARVVEEDLLLRGDSRGEGEEEGEDAGARERLLVVAERDVVRLQGAEVRLG